MAMTLYLHRNVGLERVIESQSKVENLRLLALKLDITTMGSDAPISALGLCNHPSGSITYSSVAVRGIECLVLTTRDGRDFHWKLCACPSPPLANADCTAAGLRTLPRCNSMYAIAIDIQHPCSKMATNGIINSITAIVICGSSVPCNCSPKPWREHGRRLDLSLTKTINSCITSIA